MSTQTQRNRKFTRYMKGPAKFLARARDFYVRSLSSCASNPAYGGVAGGGGPNLPFTGLPRSFSANSACSRDEDLRELVRIASTRSLTGKVEAELLRSRSASSAPMTAGGGVAVVPRSRTVTVGRIDEDKPYEFGGDDVGVRPEVYSRSRSHAVSRKSSINIV